MNRERVYNFSQGSSMLPLEVLERAQAEMLNYNGTGMSVCEFSNRSDEFQKILSGAEAALRELMNIPLNYKIFFIGGDESLQFAGIPMNLLSSHRCADYIVSGQYSKKACDEATAYQREKSLALDEVNMQTVRDLGVELFILEDASAFQAACEPVYAAFPQYAEIIEMIKAELN